MESEGEEEEREDERLSPEEFAKRRMWEGYTIITFCVLTFDIVSLCPVHAESRRS